MADRLKELTAKRGQIKARITRFKNFIDNFNEDQGVSQLTVRHSKLVQCWDEFDAVQSEIEALGLQQAETTGEEAQERELFENSYFEVMAAAETTIKKLTDNKQETKEVGNVESNSPAVRLPVINLPVFYGHYDEWLSFYDTFQALIHTNTSLHEIQKFHYLRSSLRGEALQVIQSLEISAENYVTAWSLLKQRFENKRYIVNKHIKYLFEQPCVERESASALKQLLDTTVKHLRALKAMGQPVDSWDALLLHLLTNKMDTSTHKEWEKSLRCNELPTMTEFIQFLQQRCQVLDAVDNNRSTHKTSHAVVGAIKKRSSTERKAVHTTAAYVTRSDIKCRVCNKSHHIYQCEIFKGKSALDRIKEVKRLSLCMNCLKPSHQAKNCSSGSCKVCNQKHNTLLHNPQGSRNQEDQNEEHEILTPFATPFIPASQTTQTTTCVTQEVHRPSSVMLSTAVVYVNDIHGQPHSCRALLDSASQPHILTNRLAELLQLKRRNSALHINGIGASGTKAGQSVQATVKSRYNAYSATLDFIVLPQITQYLPSSPVNISSWNLPKHIELADPEFHKPQRIDLLLGAEIFFELLCVGQFRLTPGYPTLQKTTLGWIVSGRTDQTTTALSTLCHLSVMDRVDEQLQRFWTLEECPAKPPMTTEEAACETHFKDNFRRADNGRFVVKLPVKYNIEELGESKEIATRRFLSLERRLAKDPARKEHYVSFMREYEELEHMQLVEEQQEDTSQRDYYLPHHCVIKESSTTTKLRVVFDASCNTTSGISLNDALMVGPTIQDDLFSIIVRFRRHQYVITADIKMMYRAISVDPSDTNLQKIVWRDDPEKPLRTYRLQTVTYGTASAPFLATRCLQQLALEEMHNFPKAAAVVLRDFYVDDLQTGGDVKEEVSELQTQLITLLKKGCFELRKWCSNDSSLLSNIPLEHRETYHEVQSNDDPSVRSLGLLWNPMHDHFQFSIKQVPSSQRVTKRLVLSTIARIFDPLGLLGPVILKAKIFLQRIWQLKLDWDESLPTALYTEWTQFQDELALLQTVKVPRKIVSDAQAEVEIHGFSDASERGYGTCVYVVSKTGDNVTSQLVCSKSRVAPIKTQTIPRLELCAAALLAKLIHKVVESLQCETERIILWTDSTIVLAWLRSPATHWKTFVANRVSEIQQLTSKYEWKHVRTEFNPADHISRGLAPSQILNNELWWHGPAWLTDLNINATEELLVTPIEIPERREKIVSLVSTDELKLFERYSTLGKLQRVTAYCMRFISNASLPSHKRRHGHLTVEELHTALLRLIKLSQDQHFLHEVKALRDGQEVDNRSKLKGLNPFLDADGIIRVGGRIQESSATPDQKHPIVLAPKCNLTRLIARNEHIKQLHAGPLLLLSSLRQLYWPINGRNLARSVARQCVTCFRNKPKEVEQIMGNLPADRVQPTRPFLHSGVDFCGPVYIKSNSQRNSKLIKAYVAIFVCFSTKAVHIELVNNLTTEAFLGALKRFVSRRGKCAKLYSDNATNFVGAKRELQELKTLFESQDHQRKMHDLLSKDGIEWNFIPARSPHFGALWESAVRLLKYHLRRTVGNAALTYEEMSTALTMIEACLNSRPLTPLSTDPKDLLPLTPGHFLIGDALTAIAQPNLTLIPTNRLSRWQHVQKIYQHFWARWSKEYLSSLQERSKWKRQQINLKIGDIVLIKEDNLPPLHWKMARVIEVHSGKDGIVRVATVNTASGNVKRAVHRLCPLPSNVSC
jgi:transposase InsO family protein